MFQFKSNSVMRGCVHAGKDVVVSLWDVWVGVMVGVGMMGGEKEAGQGVACCGCVPRPACFTLT